MFSLEQVPESLRPRTCSVGELFGVLSHFICVCLYILLHLHTAFHLIPLTYTACPECGETRPVFKHCYIASCVISSFGINTTIFIISAGQHITTLTALKWKKGSQSSSFNVPQKSPLYSTSPDTDKKCKRIKEKTMVPYVFPNMEDACSHRCNL